MDKFEAFVADVSCQPARFQDGVDADQTPDLHFINRAASALDLIEKETLAARNGDRLPERHRDARALALGAAADQVPDDVQNVRHVPGGRCRWTIISNGWKLRHLFFPVIGTQRISASKSNNAKHARIFMLCQLLRAKSKDGRGESS